MALSKRNKLSFDYRFSTKSKGLDRIYSTDQGLTLTIFLRENCAGIVRARQTIAATVRDHIPEYDFIHDDDERHPGTHEIMDNQSPFHFHLTKKNRAPISVHEFELLVGKLKTEFDTDPKDPMMWYSKMSQYSFYEKYCKPEENTGKKQILDKSDADLAIQAYTHLSRDRFVCPKPDYFHQRYLPERQDPATPLLGAGSVVGGVAATFLACYGIFRCCFARKNQKNNDKKNDSGLRKA